MQEERRNDTSQSGPPPWSTGMHAQTSGDPPPAEGDPPPVDDDLTDEPAPQPDGDPPPYPPADGALEGDPPPNGPTHGTESFPPY